MILPVDLYTFMSNLGAGIPSETFGMLELILVMLLQIFYLAVLVQAASLLTLKDCAQVRPSIRLCVGDRSCKLFVRHAKSYF